jgi:hypothetical protein
MLSRDVCGRCRVNWWGESGLAPIYMNTWACAHKEVYLCRMEQTVPPKECPHILEHAVAETVNIDTKIGD